MEKRSPERSGETHENRKSRTLYKPTGPYFVVLDGILINILYNYLVVLVRSTTTLGSLLGERIGLPDDDMTRPCPTSLVPGQCTSDYEDSGLTVINEVMMNSVTPIIIVIYPL